MNAEEFRRWGYAVVDAIAPFYFGSVTDGSAADGSVTDGSVTDGSAADRSVTDYVGVGTGALPLLS